MRLFSSVFSLLVSAAVVSAADIWVQVGANTTNNASLIFQPAEIHAGLNDTIYFNFTSGNHTATQSSFSQPCIPAIDSSPSFNGFDSGLRLASNGSNVTFLPVPLLPENYNVTMWFYDASTCGEGGVGVINPNDSSTETLAGFSRNAIRLNGTATSSSVAPSSTAPSSSSSSPSASTSPNAAGRNAVLGGLSAIPLIIAALALQ
ncbi:hypothetical protein B0H21DRAFT_445078 [Amylocystis lapponica]|nr:hypothetical protein B0H21DRAFT_445078 [Amylocystis lapponica]